MTECESKIVVSRSKKRKVELEFGVGDITSDGGVSLLGLADKRLNLTKRLAGFLQIREIRIRHDIRFFSLYVRGYTE